VYRVQGRRFARRLRAVATFEATEASASVVFRTVASVKTIDYFEQLNFTFDDCRDYIAVT